MPKTCPKHAQNMIENARPSKIDPNNQHIILPAKGDSDHLMVLLHGYGADARDMRPLADHFRHVLPQAAFYVPDAPENCATHPQGRQWFALNEFRFDLIEAGLKKAWPPFFAKVEKLLEKLSLAKENLILSGFSQGAMMALHGSVCLSWQHQTTICFSGFLPISQMPSVIQKTSIAMVHGAEDQVIPIEFACKSADMMQQAGISVDFHVGQKLGHSIDNEALNHACNFLSKTLKEA